MPGRPKGSHNREKKATYDNFYFVDWRAVTEKNISRMPLKDQAIVRPMIEDKRAKGIGDRRTEKLTRDLYSLSKIYAGGKPLFDMQKEDIKQLFSKLFNSDKSYYTIADYRNAIRQFLKTRDGEKFNPITYEDILTSPVMGKKKNQMRAGKEVLDQNEIDALMKQLTDIRAQAFVMMAFDACARGGDISKLDVRNVERKGPEVWINFTDTKTGANRTGLTFSAPYVLKLIALHPRSEPDMPLFWQKHNGQIIRWGYSSIRMMLHRAAIKAGIKKKFGLHIFRASGATTWKKMGATDQDIERRGGWAPGSSALREGYYRFGVEDSHQRIQQIMTGQKPEKQEIKFKTVICSVCGASNQADLEYCNICHHSLSLQSQMKEETRIAKLERINAEMQKQMDKLMAAAAYGTVVRAKRRYEEEMSRKKQRHAD